MLSIVEADEYSSSEENDIGPGDDRVAIEENTNGALSITYPSKEGVPG